MTNLTGRIISGIPLPGGVRGGLNEQKKAGSGERGAKKVKV
jgi:hypothetical protein